MIVLVWAALAVVLVAAEMHHVAFYALFGAIGSAAAAMVAWFFPHAYAAQLACAVAATTAGVMVVRPYVSRAFAQRSEGRVAVGVHGGLVGEEVLVLDSVTPNAGGHVRLVGETWMAVSAIDTEIPAGSRAIVTRVRGTTLFVIEVA